MGIKCVNIGIVTDIIPLKKIPGVKQLAKKGEKAFKKLDDKHKMSNITGKFSEKEARHMEQYIIDANNGKENLNNKRNAISDKRQNKSKNDKDLLNNSSYSENKKYNEKLWNEKQRNGVKTKDIPICKK